MKIETILLITAFDDTYNIVNDLLKRITEIINLRSGRLVRQVHMGDAMYSLENDDTLNLIKEASLIICNLSSINSNVLYEIGITHGLDKPMILLVDNELTIPFNISPYRYFTYDRGHLVNSSIISRLTEAVVDALDNPEEWKVKAIFEKAQQKKSVFISYNHKDKIYLERLLVHLKPLERKGNLEVWSDTLILGGQKWKEEIEKALEKAAIGVLLISADFLASDFIINNELPSLLRDAQENGTIIIPLILKPCRFLREPTLNQFQSTNDPLKPICGLPESESELIYEKLSERIEMAFESE